MVAKSKDSPEVIEFMALFSRLKEWCDDQPSNLIRDALEDQGISELCSHLWAATFYLKINERRHRSLFTAPVDPKFVSEFRDYEQRYMEILSHLEYCDFVGGNPLDMVPERVDHKREWDYADRDAGSEAAAVRSAIEFAKSNIEQDSLSEALSEELSTEIEDGIASWERLCQDTGFDLRGVLRRRALIPFVLIPRHVGAKHGSAQKLSLLTNLRQAHEAFIFGAPHASLALMRSILETVLREHYHAEGRDLNEKIGNAYNRRLLPRNTNLSTLHKLRRLSNAILHMDTETSLGLQEMTSIDLETEILSFLYVLRDLIEQAKTSPSAR